MKKFTLVLVGVLMAAAIPAISTAADVNVNVQMAQAGPVAAEAPPPLEVQNPEMVVVPSGDSYVYMVPNTYGVYFHNGDPGAERDCDGQDKANASGPLGQSVCHCQA